MESFMGAINFLIGLAFMIGILGLINPRWVRMPSRAKSSKIFFGASFLTALLIALLINAGVLPDKRSEASTAVAPQVNASAPTSSTISPTPENVSANNGADTATYPGEFDFKGVTLGMSEQEVRKNLPGLSRYTYSDKTSKNFTLLGCVSRWKDDDEGCQITLANQRVKDAEFHFHDNKLGKIKIDFDEDYFSTVLDGLTTKFGKPNSQDSTDLVRSFTGVSAKSHDIYWINNHTMFLTDHLKNGDSYESQGRLVIYDRIYLEAINADQAQHGKKTDQEDL